jgi:hypothetical protein
MQTNFEVLSLWAIILGGLSVLSSILSAIRARRAVQLSSDNERDEVKVQLSPINERDEVEVQLSPINERDKVKQIEAYLQDELNNNYDYQGLRGLRSANNIASETGLAEEEVERLALRSPNIRVLRHMLPGSDLAAGVLYQFGESNIQTTSTFWSNTR